MAYEFFTAGDRIKTGYSTNNTLRSYGLRFMRDGDGVGATATGVLYGRRSGTNGDFIFHESGRIVFCQQWTSGLVRWHTNDATLNSTGVWNNIVITYDSGDTAANAVFYANQNIPTVTIVGSVTGPIINSTAEYCIANRDDGATTWEGKIAEVAMWSDILTADEALAYNRGYSPLLIRPDALVVYCPLVRSVQDMLGNAPTTFGTPSVYEHPSVMYPRRKAMVAMPFGPQTYSQSFSVQAVRGPKVVRFSTMARPVSHACAPKSTRSTAMAARSATATRTAKLQRQANLAARKVQAAHTVTAAVQFVRQLAFSLTRKATASLQRQANLVKAVQARHTVSFIRQLATSLVFTVRAVRTAAFTFNATIAPARKYLGGAGLFSYLNPRREWKPRPRVPRKRR